MPSTLLLIQSMSILAIIFTTCPVGFACYFLTDSSRMQTGKSLRSYLFFSISTLFPVVFACIALGSWNYFIIPLNYFSEIITTAPIWKNALTSTGNSELIPTSDFLSPRTGNGYNLFAAGLLFLLLSFFITCLNFCSFIRHSRQDEEGTFGLGSTAYLNVDASRPPAKKE